MQHQNILVENADSRGGLRMRCCPNCTLHPALQPGSAYLAIWVPAAGLSCCGRVSVTSASVTVEQSGGVGCSPGRWRSMEASCDRVWVAGPFGTMLAFVCRARGTCTLGAVAVACLCTLGSGTLGAVPVAFASFSTLRSGTLGAVAVIFVGDPALHWL